jgi:DNA-directed RNA polymerase subunit RPC12/RpoP
MSNLGRQFNPIGYDYNRIYDHPNYDKAIEGTLCPKCKTSFAKSNPSFAEGSEESPLHRHDLQKQDPKKDLLIECGECGKKIWGKYEKD